MRISDWSSDVCSSDLAGRLSLPEQVKRLAEHRRRGLCLLVALLALFEEVRDALLKDVEIGEHQFGLYRLGRSEEHTSELQSLMRISYAVFCLKKKKKEADKMTKMTKMRIRLLFFY